MEEGKLMAGARVESAHGGAPTKLYAAIVRAQANVRAVAKDSANPHHKYSYASADDMMAEGGRALASAELALIPLGWTYSPPEHHFSQDGVVTMTQQARISIRFRLVHSSGEFLDFDPVSIPTIPEKGRPEDKAESTARTYILGYFVRDLLLIPRVEANSQPDQRDDRNYEPLNPGLAKTSPATTAPAAEPEPGWAMKSIEIKDGIEKALRAATTDPLLVEASKPAAKSLKDGAITQAQYNALAAIFVECRKALAAAPAATAAAPATTAAAS